MKGSYDTSAAKNSDTSKTSNDFNNETNNEKILKLENLLLKRLSENGKHQRNDKQSANMNEQLTSRNGNNPDVNLNYRWRRLPLYNFRHFQIANDNWLNDLEREQNPHANGNDEDYI